VNIGVRGQMKLVVEPFFSHDTKELRECGNAAWYTNDDRVSYDDYDDYTLADIDDYYFYDDEYTGSMNRQSYTTGVTYQLNGVQCCTSNLERCFGTNQLWTGVPSVQPTHSPVVQPTPMPTSSTQKSSSIVVVNVNIAFLTRVTKHKSQTSDEFAIDDDAQQATCQALLLSVGVGMGECSISNIGDDEVVNSVSRFVVTFETKWPLLLNNSNISWFEDFISIRVQEAIDNGDYQNFYDFLCGNSLLVDDEYQVETEAYVVTPSSSSLNVLAVAVGVGVGGFVLCCIILVLVLRQRQTKSQQVVHHEMAKR